MSYETKTHQLLAPAMYQWSCGYICQYFSHSSKQRHNSLWRSRSENDLTNQQLTLMQQDTRDPSVDTMNFFNLDLTGQTSSDDGPRSWSPADGAAEIFMKASHFGEFLHETRGKKYSFVRVSLVYILLNARLLR